MTQTTKTLVAFATRWGTKFGGINSFNADLLPAFSAAFYNHVRTVCVVLHATDEEQETALREDKVHLLQLSLPNEKSFPAHLEASVWQALQAAGIHPSADETVWLGHDRITGDITLAAAKARGGKSALIHHMSYGRYEAFSENGALAYKKTNEQEQLFAQADFVLAVGPLLRDALTDILHDRKIAMLVPGLPEIPTRVSPNAFKAFLSGRLSDDARKIKQAHLGVAAFAKAICLCTQDPGLPDALRGENEPQLVLRGVDFENSEGDFDPQAEQELKAFAEDYAKRAFGLTALPFTMDRAMLFNDLRGASVAMMPSWHEGFGLVAWEAIAAGVPLILSNKSGVSRLLKELNHGLYTSWVTEIDVAGSSEAPYFLPKDLDTLAGALIGIAKDPQAYRSKAAQLREALSNKFNWANCARQLSDALDWNFPQADSNVARPPHPPIAALPVSAPSSALNRLLELPSPTWQRTAGLSDSQLLRAEEAVIPFDPNGETFLQTQLDWAHSADYPLAVRLLTGQGGVGKTRLALELCQRLQAQGWQTGFVRGECDTTDAATLGRLIWDAKQNYCVVLDYAETRQPVLLALLKTVLANRQTARASVQVRVLLLARDGGDWWRMLPGIDTTCESLLDGSASSGPFMVPQLHDTEEARHAAYQLALRTFSKRLEIDPPDNQPSLDEAHFALPLYIQMAALLALRGERPKSAEALARALVNHERRYWGKALTKPGTVGDEREQQASLLMTLATLSSGIVSDRDIEPIWRAVVGADKAQLKSLFKTLTPLYPDRQGLQGLRPDLLGEALVAQTLLGSNGVHMLDAVLSKGDVRLRHASLTVLARLLRYRPELAPMLEDALCQHFSACASELIKVCIETPSPLPPLAERAFKRLPKQQRWQIAGAVGKKIEFNVLPLVGLKVLICEDGLEKAKQKLNLSKLETMSDHAAAISSLSAAFHYNGANEAALNASKEAVEAYEKLATVNLVRFEPDWAMSLGNFAIRLADQGQHDEALVTAKQALDMFEKLAQTKPERFEHEWARSLGNYAIDLAEHGQHDQALVTAKQALNIYRKLAVVKPERFEHDKARLLGNYAACLADQGQHNEALLTAKQALDIYQKLAKTTPERFEPDWARSLRNYASHLADQGQHDEALTTAKQALGIDQKLAQIKPERFEPDWAGSLNNHSVRLADHGQYDEALTTIKQALDIYQALAQSKPARYQYSQQRVRLTLALLEWLATLKTMHDGLSIPLPEIAFQTDARALAFQWSALSALAETNMAHMQTIIEQALSCWDTLDQGQQNDWKDFFFLLAALTEHRLGADAAPQNWRAQWVNYSMRRQGHLPMWMTEVARRLGFEL